MKGAAWLPTADQAAGCPSLQAQEAVGTAQQLQSALSYLVRQVAKLDVRLTARTNRRGALGLHSRAAGIEPAISSRRIATEFSALPELHNSPGPTSRVAPFPALRLLARPIYLSRDVQTSVHKKASCAGNLGLGRPSES
jgi:hypothetical protein